jgi:hypothetical protein
LLFKKKVFFFLCTWLRGRVKTRRTFSCEGCFLAFSTLRMDNCRETVLRDGRHPHARIGFRGDMKIRCNALSDGKSRPFCQVIFCLVWHAILRYSFPHKGCRASSRIERVGKRTTASQTPAPTCCLQLHRVGLLGSYSVFSHKRYAANC